MATSKSVSEKISTRLLDFPELEPYCLLDVKKTDDCKSLGRGSFGAVDEMRYQGTPCAVKCLHSSLVDPTMQGENRIIRRFAEECKIMSNVRHPNVVQFLGLHRNLNSPFPMLVMEKLAMSVDDLLTTAEQKQEEIPLSLKVSILSDTARGLVYLHNHNPQIIHRDLTSRNVLLTLAMQAKITDLGNALIIDADLLTQKMTTAPGTASYMPPEAVNPKSKYDSAIDMFSYGHLALYVMIQEFPRRVLAATYCDESKATETLIARNELERRSVYIDILHQKVGNDHFLSQIIKQCLQNAPGKRPNAVEVLGRLEEMFKAAENFADDHYFKFLQASKFDLIKMLQRGKSQSPEPYTYPIVAFENKKITAESEVVQPAPPVLSSSLVVDRSQQIKVGVPSNLILVSAKVSKTNTFRRASRIKKKEYMFKISSSDSTLNLVYYEEKTKNKVDLSYVTDITPTESTLSEYPFEISFKGRSPLKLIALSKDERNSWVEALKDITSVVTPSRQLQKIASAPNLKDYSTRMYANEAYNIIIPSRALVPSVSSLSLNQAPLKPGIPPNQRVLSLYEDPGTYVYEYIKRSASESDVLETTPKPMVGTVTKDPLATDDYYTEMSTEVNTESTSQEPNLSSLDSTTVSKTLRMLSRFNSEQMEHLIEMLKMTRASGQAMNDSTIEEREISIDCSPTDPSTSQIEPNLFKSGSVESPSVQITVTGEEQTKEIHREERSPSELNIEPADDESVVPIQRRQSEGSVSRVVLPKSHERRQSEGVVLIKSVADTVKRCKLFRLLSETEAASKTSLLVIGDGSDSYQHRPDWAKASTEAKVQGLTSREDMSLLSQQPWFIKRTSLKDMEEIGEGYFGKVYKATLVRSTSEKKLVAVKTVKRYKSAEETKDFYREMDVMTNLMHPNIIQLYGIVQQNSPWLVLQYLKNGDLKKYLINNKHGVDRLINYMIDVAMGMHYLVGKGLVHRDLAARNVMVDERETCKVADFGLLREIPKDNTIYQATTEMPWPIRWMAPESLDKREFSPATDVWSFGVLLWEMYYPSRLPYDELDDFQLLSKIHSGYRLSVPPPYPSDVAKIMEACWQEKPDKRPSFLLISTVLTNLSMHQGEENYI